MTKYISKIDTQTITKGKQYQVLRKERNAIFILNDEKKIEKFEKAKLKQYFDV